MDVIEKATHLDYGVIIIGICTIMAVFKIVCNFFIWLFSFLGLETKSMRQKREEHELLITTVQNLNALQVKQEEDVKQSIEHDTRIKEDLRSVSEKMDNIAIALDNMEKKNNVTEMKKLKEKLVGYYNRYKDIGEWSSVEKDVFWDLFEDYENRGGDGFIHSIVEPVMRGLKLVD